jgi:hypothetical protein
MTAPWPAARLAELDKILERHQPDEDGRCARCVRVGLFYDRSPARWPCGAYEFAERERARLAPPVPRQRNQQPPASGRQGRGST